MKLIGQTKFIILGLGVLLFCVNAHAGAMQDFNLIVLGDMTAGASDVHGRTLVAGNIDGEAKDFAIDMNAISNDTTTAGVAKTDALIVGKQILATGDIHVDKGGTRVGGAYAGDNRKLLNSDYTKYNDTEVDKVIQAVSKDIQATTDWFDDLNKTSTTESVVYKENISNAATLNVAATGGVAVFKLDADQLNSSSPLANLYLTGNLSDVDMILITVTGSTTNAQGETELVTSSGLHLSSEFTKYADKIVWYFPELENLKLSTGWAGAVVAADADFDFVAPIEGSVVVNNMTLSSEVHLKTPGWQRPGDPSSPVPEPATAFLFGCGILAVAGSMRQRTLQKEV